MTPEEKKRKQLRFALAAELLRVEYDGLDESAAYTYLHHKEEGENSRLEVGFQQIDGMPNVVPSDLFTEAFALIGGE